MAGFTPYSLQAPIALRIVEISLKRGAFCERVCGMRGCVGDSFDGIERVC